MFVLLFRENTSSSSLLLSTRARLVYLSLWVSIFLKIFQKKKNTTTTQFRISLVGFIIDILGLASKRESLAGRRQTTNINNNFFFYVFQFFHLHLLVEGGGEGVALKNKTKTPTSAQTPRNIFILFSVDGQIPERLTFLNGRNSFLAPPGVNITQKKKMNKLFKQSQKLYLQKIILGMGVARLRRKLRPNELKKKKNMISWISLAGKSPNRKRETVGGKPPPPPPHPTKRVTREDCLMAKHAWIIPAPGDGGWKSKSKVLLIMIIAICRRSARRKFGHKCARERKTQILFKNLFAC